MSPKVSVIVPVYNAAAYLPHCLDTLTCQTLKELEIILVLDCPTDGSEKIAEDYAARFPQIRLLYNEKNLHAGESRNRGLDVATGEYIGFVDADDFVEARMFEDMYLTAKERNADVVLTDRQTCSPGEEPAVTLKDRAALQVQGGEEFLRSQLLAMVEGQFGLALSWLYTHIYRREFLQRHGLRLADSRGMMSEDLLFNVQVYRILLDEGGKWVYLPQAYYHYVVYEGSLCHSPGFYTFAMTVPLVDNLMVQGGAFIWRMEGLQGFGCGLPGGVGKGNSEERSSLEATGLVSAEACVCSMDMDYYLTLIWESSFVRASKPRCSITWVPSSAS